MSELFEVCVKNEIKLGKIHSDSNIVLLLPNIIIPPTLRQT